MNLDIIPLSDLQKFAKQKCLIPLELYPQSTPIGSVAICKDSKECEYLCRIFPTETSSYCAVGMDVLVKSGNSKDLNRAKLVEVSPLGMINPKSPTVLYATLIVNDNIFKMKSFKLKLLIRDLLQSYILVDKCQVQLDKVGQNLGISEILIRTKEYNNVFELDSTTKIDIDNVQFKRPHNILPTHLEGIDGYSEKLQCLLNNLKIQNELNWAVRPSLNALVVGPQGSGKTSICSNFLLENNCNTFVLNSADVVGQYPGETEEALRGIFANVKHFVDQFHPTDPTVIFIEDIDLICPAAGKLRSSSNDEVNSSRISGQLISLIDDLHINEDKILILATTANIESLDTGLRRPGRFDNEIILRSLSEINRGSVLKQFLLNAFFIKNVTNLDDLITYLAKRTPGFVGADLSLLVQNISQIILRKPDMANDIKLVFDNVLKSFKPASIQGSDVTVIKSEENFSNIGGMTELKKTLEVSVLAGLKHTESYLRFNLQLPKGILLYGPPGCAKTTIAKCLATEANMTFIATSGAEVYSPYVGNAEKFISKIFDTARKNAPCLIFLDEIDTLVGKRTMDSKSDVQTRILSTLLTEMDGIGVKLHSAGLSATGNKILVVAATNRPDMLDDALLRPGRFDRLIHVPAPDVESRLAIFNIFRKKMPFAECVNIPNLAETTNNFSGADICNLCNEAALHAFTEDFDADKIRGEDFNKVLSKSKPSLTQNQIDWYFNFENKTL